MYSTTHPSVCQDTFEGDVGEWSNRSGVDGALVLRDNTTSQTGMYSLKLINEYEGGDFSCYAVTTPYDAEEYPLIRFDYKITPDVKTNFKVKVNGVFKDIIFADDPETDGSAIHTIGEIEGVIKDNQWHHAEFNLYKLLKIDDPDASQYIVDEIIMGDWDLSYWFSIVPGNSNPQGATYWIDNFIIANYITDDLPIEIDWEPMQPYVTEYSYVLDQVQDTAPDQISEGANTYIEYTSLDDGIWYFHVTSVDGTGNWSLANHYLVSKDITAPTLDAVSPADGETSGSADILLQIIDNVSGVDPDSISLRVEGTTYDITNGGLTYDEDAEILTFKPYNVTPNPVIFSDGQLINVSLLALSDKAGNYFAGPYSWSWTYSLQDDTTPPEAPSILYPQSHDIGLSSVTFSWIATDTSGIAGYSYELDGTEDTVPDNIPEGLITEQRYSNLPEGTYYFHVKAQDNAGNWSETTHFRITIARITLLVDDFNDGSDPNELGGDNGTFDSSGPSYCQSSYVNDAEVVFGGTGYSIMLSYYVTQQGSYSGYYMLLNHADITSYKSLSFWVMSRNGGDKFRVGLKDSAGNETKINIDLYLQGGASREYQHVIIPLVMFKDIATWQDMESFSITFENSIDPAGYVYIDNVEFISENGRIVVDNFDDGHDPNAFGADYYVATNGATMTMAYIPGIGIGGTYCYRVSYSGVTGSKYCKLVMYTADINISDADTLSFYIKGASGGERPNIYLYDGTNNIFLDIESYKAVTTAWQRVDIPLIDFSSRGVNLTHVRELAFAFEWEIMNGTIYLDNIEFISYALSIMPTLDETPEATNETPIILTGTKSAGTSIWINGIEVVPLDYEESWSANFSLTEGPNNITVLAKDSSENESEAVYRTIELDTQVPSAFVTVAGLPVINEILTFDGSNSFDNYGIASYTWNFGDGSPEESGEITTHVYTTSNTYNVTLTIYDMAGNGPVTDEVIITIDEDNIIEVGGADPDYSTIQEAIDNAPQGYIVNVYPGEYEENISLSEGVSLIGVYGGNTTIVYGAIDVADNTYLEGITFSYELSVGQSNPEFCLLNIAASQVEVRDCNLFLFYNYQGQAPLYYNWMSRIQGDNISLSGNNLFFVSRAVIGHMGAIEVGLGGASSNISLLKNNIYLKQVRPSSQDSELIGISFTDTDIILVENNLISAEGDNSNSSYTLYGICFNNFDPSIQYCDNATVKNNTISLEAKTLTSIYGIKSYSTANLNIRNNIINMVGHDNSSDAYACHVFTDTLVGDGVISLTYNIYYGVDNFAYVQPGGPPGLTITVENNTQIDPQFVDSGSGNFHILPISPAIDAGDPGDDWSNEPDYPTGSINCGAYGNTIEAAPMEIPIITNTSPANGLYATNRQRLFNASLEDNTGLQQATLWLDGDEVFNEPLTGQTYVINFTPSENLSYGRHFYHLSVVDIDGNKATATKIFTVIHQSAGCFLSGTPIQMADGTTKSIENLRVGETLLAYDETTGEFKPDAIKHVFVIPGEKEYLIITLGQVYESLSQEPRPVPFHPASRVSTGQLKVTPHHAFYLGGEWVEAGKLKVGDKLLNSENKLEPIASIKHVKDTATVYNLEINPYHTFIAGGVVVHNSRLMDQRRLVKMPRL